MRFSKTLSEYQEQPYPLLYFLIHLKIQYSRNIIWEYSSEFRRKLFPNILEIYHGNVPRIFHEKYSRNIIWEYSPAFQSELFPNILGICHGNVPRLFHEHIFSRWEACSMSERFFWNNVWQYVVISYMEEYFSAYLVCIAALLHVWNCSEFHFTYLQKHHRVEFLQKCFCLWF